MNKNLMYFLIFLGISLVIGVAFYFLKVSPAKQEIAALQKEVDALQEKVQKAKQTASKYEDMLREREILEWRKKKAESMLPSEKEVEDLLKAVSMAAAKVNVSIESFKPKGLKASGEYSEFPVEVEVACSYHELGRFFTAVAELPRIVDIDEISITSKSKGGEGGATVKASFIVRAYVKRSGAPPSDNTKGKKKRGKR